MSKPNNDLSIKVSTKISTPQSTQNPTATTPVAKPPMLPDSILAPDIGIGSGTTSLSSNIFDSGAGFSGSAYFDPKMMINIFEFFNNLLKNPSILSGMGAGIGMGMGIGGFQQGLGIGADSSAFEMGKIPMGFGSGIMPIQTFLPNTLSFSTPSTPSKKSSKMDMKKPPNEVVADNTSTPALSKLRTKAETRIANYNELVDKIAKEEGVDPNLIKAMMHQESGGDKNAISPKNASGLMQLLPSTAKSLGVKDIFDPEQNIRGGVKYIAQQLKKYNGDVKLSLAAYNAGPGAVDKYHGIPPYKETRNYVASIMAKYQS